MSEQFDGVLSVNGTVKRIASKETADGKKTWVCIDTMNAFGERETFMVKLTQEYQPNEFEEGSFYTIPVLTFVGDDRRIYYRTSPTHRPVRHQK